MLKLSALSGQQIRSALNGEGLRLRIGLFQVRLSSPIPIVTEHVSCLYGDFATLGAQDFIDFDIAIQPPQSLRRFVRRQALFMLDGHCPFKPLPYAQAAAFFEWGLNWCIAGHSNQFLIIHAAVIERNGQALLMPGTPGSGKSTLCAALVNRGWRLLSDEMALVSVADGRVYPIPRPISLKNQSLEVIKNFADQTVFGPIVHDTTKGTVGHVRPPESSVQLANVPAQAARVVFPKYQAGSKTLLTPLSKGRTLLKLAENSFNYATLGLTGFQLLADLCDQATCNDLVYSNLDEAITLFDGFIA